MVCMRDWVLMNPEWYTMRIFDPERNSKVRLSLTTNSRAYLSLAKWFTCDDGVWTWQALSLASPCHRRSDHRHTVLQIEHNEGA